MQRFDAEGQQRLTVLIKNSQAVQQSMPKDAIAISFPIKATDVIVAASDGLYDNMFDEEIGDVLN